MEWRGWGRFGGDRRRSSFTGAPGNSQESVPTTIAKQGARGSGAWLLGWNSSDTWASSSRDLLAASRGLSPAQLTALPTRLLCFPLHSAHLGAVRVREQREGTGGPASAPSRPPRPPPAPPLLCPSPAPSSSTALFLGAKISRPSPGWRSPEAGTCLPACPPRGYYPHPSSPQRPQRFLLRGLASPGWRGARLVCRGWGDG